MYGLVAVVVIMIGPSYTLKFRRPVILKECYNYNHRADSTTDEK